MKVLLCGEYSSVHSELASALTKKGFFVSVLSDGDGYKGFPADIKVTGAIKRREVLGNIFYPVFDFFGLAGISRYLLFDKSMIGSDYDVVQLINPVVVHEFGALGNFLLIRYLQKKGKALFLCGLGDDSRWVAACLKKKYKYSPLDRLSFRNLRNYYGALKYIFNPAYLLLSFYAEQKSHKVLVGLDDYRIAYNGVKKAHFIRLPISVERFSRPIVKDYSKEPIVVFHAWQKGKELKKGNDILHDAVLKTLDVYGDEAIKYVVASGLSYDEFVKSYQGCDIYLDQVYSYDRGVAGALGLAAGKVVFSGFELVDQYSDEAPNNIKIIGVNALPDVDALVAALSFLIDNPKVVHDIQSQAYEFARNNHESSVIADQYLQVWNGLI